jgi:uncharacterized protein
MIHALVLAGGFLAVLRLGVLALEWLSTYRPSRRLEIDPSAAGLAFESIEFMAEDAVRLHGWWMPAAAPRGTVLYCHGNAGNMSGRLEFCADLVAARLNVFVFDYRGFGRSRGLPTERGLYRDARAAYEVVRAKYGDAETLPLVCYGVSLGGAVAIQLALDRPLRGLIIENAFTSLRAMARHRFPGLPIHRFLVQRFDSLAKAPAVRAPALVAHTPEDRVIPFTMGQQLAAAFGGPRRFVAGAGDHGEGGWRGSADFRRALARFLDETLPPGP